jgi:hypothetical protein
MLHLRTALVCAAITLATALVPVQVTAQTVSRSACETPKTSFRTYDGSTSSSTVSTTFVDVPPEKSTPVVPKVGATPKSNT